MRKAIFGDIKKKPPIKKLIGISIIIALVIIMLTTAFIVIRNARNKSNKPVSNIACTSGDNNSILSRSIESLQRPDLKTSMDTLQALKKEINGTKNYEKDISCVYILTIYSLNYESLDDTEKLINQYETLLKANPSSKQSFFLDVESLRTQLKQRREVYQSVIKNNIYIKDIPAKK